MTDVPDHWCKVLELEMLNLTQQQRKTISIPMKVNKTKSAQTGFFVGTFFFFLDITSLFQDDMTFEKCLRYSINWSELVKANIINTFNHSSDWPVEPCLEGYKYDTSEVKSSIVIDVSIYLTDTLEPLSQR